MIRQVLTSFCVSSTPPNLYRTGPSRQRCTRRNTVYSNLRDINTPPAKVSADLTSATALLSRAAASYINSSSALSDRPAAIAVSSALLALERNHRSREYSGLPPSGQWRVVLTANPRARLPLLRSFYFPEWMRIRHTFKNNIFQNEASALGMNLRFFGPFRWVPRMRRLEFTFCSVVFTAAGRSWQKNGIDKDGDTLEGRTVKTLPFFTFFEICDEKGYAASRGREGGLALYVKLPEQDS